MEIQTAQTLSAQIADEAGNQKVMLHATYGARSLSISCEVLDAAYVRANTAAVESDVAAFFERACCEAAKAGQPTSRVAAG